MKGELENILNDLSPEEVDKLLQRSMEFHLDAGARKRIERSVLEKAGFEAQPWLSPRAKWLLAAAALMLLPLLLAFPAKLTKVYAGIRQMFNFIPGYGIVEKGGDELEKNSEPEKKPQFLLDTPDTYGPEIQLSVAELTSSENEIAAMTLKNVIATKDKISVTIMLKRKNLTEDQMIQEEQRRTSPRNPKVTLQTGGSAKLTYYTFASSFDGRSYDDWYTFKVNPADIDTNTTYRVEYADYGLSLNFKLKKYATVESLDEIGPTATHNDISITAVPSLKDGVLTVDLYPVNKSKYRITDFARQGDRVYLGRHMHLETSRGNKSFEVPDDTVDSPRSRFLFNVSPGDKNLVLKIPYLVVSTSEVRNILLKSPPEGQREEINQRVEFEDCVMTIVDVERGNGNVIMNIKYENKSPNKIMMRAGSFGRTDPRAGMPGGGGFSGKLDSNGVITKITYSSSQLGNDVETIPFTFAFPTYYLVDEYSLKLNIDK